MITFSGKDVVVVGMAKSGLAAVELLRKQGARVRAVDERFAAQLGSAGERLEALGVALLPQKPESLAGADLIVISPGVPADLEDLTRPREAGVPVIGEVELASYFLQGPVIGITGANGKTTTTAMTGHILRQSGIAVQVGGNIGTPLTAMIDSSKAGQWNVIELSSFQLETISRFRANIAVALNVTPDHLDRHHTFENYVAAKRRLFETQQAGDFAVLNADDASCVGYAQATAADILWFSVARPVTPGVYLGNGKLYFDELELLPISDIPLKGIHNVENTMAAAAAARLAGASLSRIAAAIRTFPGVEHRLEFVRERQGVSYYNDSKATNVDAAQKAIDAFAGGLWIILGGKDKNSDYTVLRDSLRRKSRGILLIGAAAPKIASQLGDGLPLIQAGTLEAAVETAAAQAGPGETVLLAPACASFDQFENFEHRGRVFKTAVMQL
ncbi:MAG TPA: UDP-N-acetylmuramoyl-L-alanine--D-glutamate ligase [Bryobacteraceae bacterium]|nr:UDP-N-acetylmuramoyl-L-alanine--D-glutamate ligase [Bryobacteraceae bacterium]